MFHPIPPKPDFKTLEEETLKFWKERDIFHKSMDRRKDVEPFVFFESSNFVAMAVVGGLRQLSGGVIGGIALTWLPELLRLNIRGFENYYLMINALIVILIVVFLPNGLGDSLFKGLSRLWREEPRALTLHFVKKTKRT